VCTVQDKLDMQTIQNLPH